MFYFLYDPQGPTHMDLIKDKCLNREFELIKWVNGWFVWCKFTHVDILLSHLRKMTMFEILKYPSIELKWAELHGVHKNSSIVDKTI
jgi:hypothetical protein